MEIFSDKNNYIFECMKCGCTAFKLLSDGYTGCMQCSKKYSWVSGFKNWIPHTMSAEEYIIKVQKKEWDPKKLEFVERKKLDLTDKIPKKPKLENKTPKKTDTKGKKKGKGKKDEDEV